MNEIERILAEIAALSEEGRAALWSQAVARKLVGVPASQPAPDQAAPDQPTPPAARKAPAPGATTSLTLIFDGGSRGNPGPGYGSYALIWPGQTPDIRRLQFGPRMTSNEAEYDTLIGALEGLLAHLAQTAVDATSVRLEVRGDSLLVINQLGGSWQVREARLRPRWQKARELLQRFASTTLRHQPREKTVAVLGH
jgi:ribonuclease HI